MLTRGSSPGNGGATPVPYGQGVETTTARRQRHIAFDAAFNFRDLGGYATPDGTIRWNTLFRADGIHQLTGADLERFAELGIRTVVDLRTADEVELARFSRLLPVVYWHLPLLERTWDAAALSVTGAADAFLAARYLEMLEIGSTSIATVIRLLGDQRECPLVFHCAAGKDRTGVVAAVVLSLVGVDDEAIVSDYALSAAGMVRMVEWVRANRPEIADAMTDQPDAFLQAPESAMRRFLCVARSRYGSMRDYVAGIGVDAATVERLCDHLVT